MKKLKYLIMFLVYAALFSFIVLKETYCNATWYDTKYHPKVHRNHSTAAISTNLIESFDITVGKKDKIKGSLIKVTNISNKKTDTVEITDKCGGINHIDLSLTSFEKIAKKSVGRIEVKIRKIE